MPLENCTGVNRFPNHHNLTGNSSFWLSFVEAGAGDYKVVDNNESLNGSTISHPKQQRPYLTSSNVFDQGNGMDGGCRQLAAGVLLHFCPFKNGK